MNDIIEKLEETTSRICESVSFINESLNTIFDSDEYRKTIEYLSTLLTQDVQDMKLCSDIKELKKQEIVYEDIIWFQDVFGDNTLEESIKELQENEKKTKLDNYMLEVIENKFISPREKIVILLAHFEEFAYQMLNHSREKKEKFKDVIFEKLNNTHKLGMEAYRLIALSAVVAIIFSSTDNFKGEIDRRIPFRNNILHRGTMEYKDSEITEAYELLVYFMSILVLLEN